jgi:murein DD-endopeptidase MepM/ murein hydrolase activator NlpD
MPVDLASKKNLRDPYRLVVVKEDTLEEVGSYRLSLLNLYLLISSILFITSLVVIAILFFTPLKRLVPGYGKIESDREYVELYQKVTLLEEQLSHQKLYTENFRKILLGGTSSEDSAEIFQSVDNISNEQEADFAMRQMELPVVPIREDTPAEGQAPEEKQSLKTSNILDYLYFVTPVKGPISAGFDLDINHFGVDILAPKNTPVKSILDGHVIASDWTLETGNTIAIQHDNNLVTFYKHKSALVKKLGKLVKAGEAVSIIGNTGSISSGPHLHFELWLDGKPIDPTRFIEFE